MTASAKIRYFIGTLPAGQPFSSNELWHLASPGNVRVILSRMVKTGELKRVARGVFVKPKHLPEVGETLPSAYEVSQKLAKLTGETIVVHGAEAARQLGLTTQVPMKLVFYTNGNTRTIQVGNRDVKLIHVNPSRLYGADKVSGLVISALNYLGRSNVTLDIIAKVRQKISDEDYSEVIASINKMPAWLADIFNRYQKDEV